MRKIKRYLYKKTTPLVMTLVIMAVGVFSLGAKLNSHVIASEFDQNEDQIVVFKMAQFQKIAGKSAELESKIQVMEAKPHTEILTKQEADEMIDTMFPAQFRERFKKITQQCENGRLKSDAENINKDGTKDVGMAQINNKWHAKRVQKMFGLDFETAMKMPILNYIYAAYLVEHDQNFHAWACDRIVSK